MTECTIRDLIESLSNISNSIDQIKDESDRRRLQCAIQEAKCLARLLQKEYTKEKIENEANHITRRDSPSCVDAYWDQMKCDGDYMG